MAEPQVTPSRPSHKIAPIIDLDTLAEPLTLVTIDGTPYGIRPKDLLSIKEQRACMRLGNRYEALFEREAPPLTDDEEQECADCLDRLTRIVLDAPDAIHRKLNDFQRRVIVETFLQLPIQSLRMWGARAAEAQRLAILNDVPSITGNSSPSSSGSSAATRSRGSRKHRSGGSGRAR